MATLSPSPSPRATPLASPAPRERAASLDASTATSCTEHGWDDERREGDRDGAREGGKVLLTFLFFGFSLRPFCASYSVDDARCGFSEDCAAERAEECCGAESVAILYTR